MNLHTADKVADWEKTPAADWNIWQKIAAKTHGFVTPGNLLSTTGHLTALYGLSHISKGNTLRGGLIFGLGRGVDAIDGKIADLSGTKSRVGAGFDAIGDKIVLGGAVIALAKSGIINQAEATEIAAQNALSVGLNAIVAKNSNDSNPNAAGKLATATQTILLASRTLENATDLHGYEELSEVANQTGNLARLASWPLGAAAIIGYATDAVRSFSAKAH